MEPMFVCGPWLPGRKDYGYPRACRPVAAHSHQDQGMTDAHIKLALVGAMQQRAAMSPLIPEAEALVVVSLLVSNPPEPKTTCFPLSMCSGRVIDSQARHHTLKPKSFAPAGRCPVRDHQHRATAASLAPIPSTLGGGGVTASHCLRAYTQSSPACSCLTVFTVH